jgi:hypothetical protein
VVLRSDQAPLSVAGALWPEPAASNRCRSD